MHQYPWPTGTISYADLNLETRAALQPYISSVGYLSPTLLVQRSATEGSFITFTGYKIRVTVVETSPDTFLVRFA